MYQRTSLPLPLIMLLVVVAPCHATITVKDHLNQDISTFRYTLELGASGKWILTLLSPYQSGENTFKINATNGESFEAIYNGEETGTGTVFGGIRYLGILTL